MFRKWDEFVREDEAANRVIPTNKRFGASYAHRHEIKVWLKMKYELVAGQRVGELVLRTGRWLVLGLIANAVRLLPEPG